MQFFCITKLIPRQTLDIFLDNVNRFVPPFYLLVVKVERNKILHNESRLLSNFI